MRELNYCNADDFIERIVETFGLNFNWGEFYLKNINPNWVAVTKIFAGYERILWRIFAPNLKSIYYINRSLRVACNNIKVGYSNRAEEIYKSRRNI